MEESPYELNGHQVLELIINTLHPYRGKLKFETKRELSNRNKILHVIRRITGRTVFDQAWTIIRQNNINRIYGQKEPHHDFSKNLYFYFISRKKPKKCYIRPVLTFLPTVFHCSCKQYRKNFKRKRYVTIVSFLTIVLYI
uniref:SWIM-type domain-containing protein n=1 Tax=Panagrolaimus sp. ES5 TaxID=591445 RepID=A0AC34GSZ3_9BILA